MCMRSLLLVVKKYTLEKLVDHRPAYYKSIMAFVVYRLNIIEYKINLILFQNPTWWTWKIIYLFSIPDTRPENNIFNWIFKLKNLLNLLTHILGICDCPQNNVQIFFFWSSVYGKCELQLVWWQLLSSWI